MTVSRFRVARMDCTAEEQLVRMALDDVDGVDAVTVDLGVREVAVQHALDTSLLTAALQDLDLGTTHLGDEDGTPLVVSTLSGGVGDIQ